MSSGGFLIALDSACDLLIRNFRLPAANVLEAVRADLFSAPGSLVRIHVDTDHPVGWGFEPQIAAMFVSSPAFHVRNSDFTVAYYPERDQLISGWLHGGDLLAGKSAILDVPFGKGRVILIGFRPQFRAQARGTYCILFNSIFYSGLK